MHAFPLRSGRFPSSLRPIVLAHAALFLVVLPAALSRADVIQVARDSFWQSTFILNGQPPIHNEYSTTAFGPWTGGNQTSTTSETGASAQIECEGSINPNSMLSSSSHFYFTFQVAQAQQFTLTGGLSGTNGLASVTLSGPSVSISHTLGATATINDTGTLLPGIYMLQSNVSASGFSFATANFSLAVPEPAAALLILPMLIGAGRRR